MKYLQLNDNDINNNNNTTHECTICLENDTSISDIIFMQSYNRSVIYFYYPYWKCECNGYFHKNCLKKWLSMDNSCPICRLETNKITCKMFMHKIWFVLYIIFNTIFVVAVLFNLIIAIYIIVNS
jgi:hypothetical protein